MGQAFNKGSRQGAQMSARAVLARRAVQPPPGDVAVAPAAPLPHYHPSAPVAAVQVEEELMDPALLDVISKVEMVKSRYEKVGSDV